MSRQLIFDLPRQVSLVHDDYFVSEANAHAYALVMAPDDWPNGKLALHGPKGSGKTHLARVFAQETGAEILSAAAITPSTLLSEASHLVIEDLEELPHHSEEALFHIHNDLSHRNGRLLLTAATPPSQWAVKLPDLASRLQATSSVSITDPDDQLLSAVLMKLFEDRQISVDIRLVSFLADRIERSFEAAQKIVAELDSEALARKRKINRALAAELLDQRGDQLP